MSFFLYFSKSRKKFIIELQYFNRSIKEVFLVKTYRLGPFDVFSVHAESDQTVHIPDLIERADMNDAVLDYNNVEGEIYELLDSEEGRVLKLNGVTLNFRSLNNTKYGLTTISYSPGTGAWIVDRCRMGNQDGEVDNKTYFVRKR